MIVSRNQSTHISIGGKKHLYFGGTNYLGLAHRKEVMKAATLAFAKYGFSSGASRLTSGQTDVLIQLEKDLAQFGSCEASVVLPSGYLTNQAVVDSLDEKIDFWLMHEKAHASIKTALSQSQKTIVIYDSKHEKNSLRQRYDLPDDALLGVFAEPVEPLTGEVIDIDSLSAACQIDDFLILDEAHSFGVLGANGNGAIGCFDLSLRIKRLIRTGTFSKAFGCYGGFILAQQELIDQIKSYANCYKASTSLPPVICAAALQALIMIKEKTTTLEPLRKNIETLNQSFVRLGLKEYQSWSMPIYHLVDSPVIEDLKSELLDNYIFLPPVGGYFKELGPIGLRFTIQAGHQSNDLERLISIFESYIAVN
ncbi:MAG: pyridoxal phosphate-dependent aminotransferase family protein [Candidatus Obscuribacterales bacterium]|nr:pyridoxal phosphate-dependent aminotransferase family protein [Candidatus Obscuribacterales bacterium]